jgi:hypothetical protein
MFMVNMSTLRIEVQYCSTRNLIKVDYEQTLNSMNVLTYLIFVYVTMSINILGTRRDLKLGDRLRAHEGRCAEMYSLYPMNHPTRMP